MTQAKAQPVGAEIAGEAVCAAQSAAGRARRGEQLCERALAFAERSAIRALGSLFGISIVVRYLRNPNPRVSAAVLRAFGAAVGQDTTIKGSVLIDNVTGDKDSTGDFSNLKVGANCYVGEGVFFDLANPIVIEDNAVIAGKASFITHAECKRSPYLSRQFPRQCGPVTVQSGAWIGYGATVLCGVTVESNAVVGAHSLLLERAESQCVYVGSPAKKLKRIE